MTGSARNFLRRYVVRKDAHSNNVIYHLSPGVPPGDFLFTFPAKKVASAAIEGSLYLSVFIYPPGDYIVTLILV